MIMRSLAALGVMMACVACASVMPGRTQLDRLPSQAGASVAAADEASVPLTELPPQALEDGACGVFFWSAAAPRRLLVFEAEASGALLVYFDGRVHRFAVEPRRTPLIVGDRYTRILAGSAADPAFSLRARVVEVDGAITRMGEAVLRTLRPDGVEIVQPVSGVRTCRTGAEALQREDPAG